MPIQKLTPPKPSEYQLNKAKRCVVTTHPRGHLVWDPMVNSEHVVSHGVCDCLGFQSKGFCSHVTAVMLFKERQKDLTAQEAIHQLFDF